MIRKLFDLKALIERLFDEGWVSVWLLDDL